ncbi:thiamine biosynthetic bifunctional enzyme [Amylostereum chailletii]|nr:thiamine biosynthetic bifunctional enzyme [Amylostereum chailletii]
MLPPQKPAVDYSVYLVTGRDLLPPGKSYLKSLQEALEGGVTVVQVREKNSETRDFLDIARQTVAACSPFNVPVLINDRIDIALACNAAGVHIGQTDMPIDIVQQLLPAHAIIGVSCTNVEHARKAVADGADYVGLGAVFSTSTKDVSEPGRVCGMNGVRDMLAVLEGSGVKTVAIGGIKSKNLARVLHGAVTSNGHALDGVAVVSEIVASQDPRAAARRLSRIYTSWARLPRTVHGLCYTQQHTATSITRVAAELLQAIKEVKPLVHQITNNVVKTQSANATLALGGSPIMAAAEEEQVDLARIPGGLLINFGTIEDVDGMIIAGREANANRRPVVFDPVGVGATNYRRQTAERLLNIWQPTVIKGNAAEISTIAKLNEVKGQGVDSLGSGFKDPVSVVRALARRERCIVVLSGPIDYISDGVSVLRLLNGHSFLGQITGSGCILGTAITTFCGVASILAERASLPLDNDLGMLVKGDMFVAAAAGVLALTIASELAAERADVHGPGSFLPALIDGLSLLTPEMILQRAKVEIVAQ